LQRYWTNTCRDCALKPRCTTGKERRITRWEHEHGLEAVQKRLDENLLAVRQRRETAEHPFWHAENENGSHPLPDETPAQGCLEMALDVLAYNLTRVMTIMGCRPLMAAMSA
jgi:Transposase DDE domain